MRDDFRKELEARDEAARNANKTQQQEEYDSLRTQTVEASAGFFEQNKPAYKILEKLGDARRIGEMLTANIESMAKQGKEITIKEAADGLKSYVWSLVEAATEDEEFKTKLQEKMKPANVGQSSGAQGVPGSARRTLSNNLTASTSEKAPPQSREDRFERATRIFNELHAKGK